MLKFLLLTSLLLSLLFPSHAQTSNYEQTIRLHGFVPGQTHDWSHESDISLPQPRLAYINLRSKYGIPYTKTSNFRDTIEYYDAMGNYFMKRAIVNVQGATSTSFPKRNVKLQLIDDEWQGEVMPTVDFDGWVKQDHFHLKAFYTDWLRGIGIVGYQLFDQMEQQMPASSNRIWKRAGVEGHKNARCYPDGFPCMMFLNGEFWGICTWQLAKHRRNMAQEKHNALHIHLDGNMNETNFWFDNLKWSAFEVRNPKGLYDMEGNAYDEGDELIDSSSPYYSRPGDSQEVRQAKQRSAQVKQAVIALTRRVGEVANLKQSGASAEEIRAAIARHFDVTSMVNYLVFSTVISNYDGFAKNWQWLTYDGGETWHVAPYDLDCTFGNYHEGTLVFPARFSYSDSDYRFKISRRGIATWFWDYYKDEIRARYAELRDCGVFSPKNISGLTLAQRPVHQPDHHQPRMGGLRRLDRPLQPPARMERGCHLSAGRRLPLGSPCLDCDRRHYRCPSLSAARLHRQPRASGRMDRRTYRARRLLLLLHSSRGSRRGSSPCRSSCHCCACSRWYAAYQPCSWHQHRALRRRLLACRHDQITPVQIQQVELM